MVVEALVVAAVVALQVILPLVTVSTARKSRLSLTSGPISQARTAAVAVSHSRAGALRRTSAGLGLSRLPPSGSRTAATSRMRLGTSRRSLRTAGTEFCSVAASRAPPVVCRQKHRISHLSRPRSQRWGSGPAVPHVRQCCAPGAAGAASPGCFATPCAH